MSEPALAGTRPTVLFPAYNEAGRITAVLDGVRERLPGADLVVVDDGSSDDTALRARAAGATVLRHPFNLGYGAALQTGYKDAARRGCELLVQMDADGQHDAADIASLLEPLQKGECDLVIGSRFVETSGYHMGFLRRLGRDLFRGVGRLSGLVITDPTSGFQAMNRRVIEAYTGDFFPVDYPDVDVLLVLHRMGLRIRERPVQMTQESRPSLLHGGLRPVYYVYKMLLSAWTASTVRVRREEPSEQPGRGDRR